MSLQHQLQYYKKENSQLQVVLKETKFCIPREVTDCKDGFQVYYENSTGPPTGSNHTQPQQLIQCDEQVIKMPISEIEEERKNNQILQEMLQTEHKQAVVDLSRCYDREGQYLQQIAKLKEENASLEQADFPETGEELMAQVNISSLTFNPSSHDETLTLMKSRLDAVRKSLSQTKRTHESSEVQNQLIKKLYEDMATLRALKEHSDQQLANLTTHKEQDDRIHSEERAGLKSSLQSMTRIYEQEMAAKNEELVNERKNIQKLSAQSAQFTIELQGYKDREELYLQQLAKLNEMNESLVEVDFPETGEELMAQVALLTHTPNPSSYDETLASMKSRLDAVRESLKHTKRSLQSSQEQNQLIKKLYEDMANLRLLKEQSDQLHSEERVGLESSQQSINRKYEEALAAKNEELANGLKTIQMLTTQSAQTALELQGYKDREETFLQQIEKLKDSSVEVDFLDASNEALMESDLLSISTPSSYDETLAHMKLQLDAVRDSLQHSRKSSQAEKQLITKLYEDIAYLQLLKEQNDKLHSENQAHLESSVQSMTKMHEHEMEAKNDELDNERKTIQILTTQSAQTALELHGYKDREVQYLQQIEKLKEMNESLVEVDFPELGDELMAHLTLLTHTPNPSSYNATLAAMKARLDAVRESLKYTKRSLQSAQEQNQLIKKLYEDMANLQLLKEQSDQLHSEERAGLESSVQSIKESLAAKNEEFANEMKTIQMLTTQCAKTALELQGYKDREEKFLQQIEKLKEMNESLVEVDFPETGEQLMAQVKSMSNTASSSSYNETIAAMKSRLDAVRESLKHTKRSLQSSQEQNQLIRKLYEDIANLRLLKEQMDQLHSEERAGLESSRQCIKESLAAKNEELANEMKTIHMLTTQSAQTALEVQGYKDREEKFLQQIEKLKEENKSLVEATFLDTNEELLVQSDLLSVSKPSSYNETIALMKSRLHAVRESLKHTKHTPQSSQAQNQLINKLYEDMETLRILKERSDELHSEERAGLISGLQSMDSKYEQEMAARKNELDNETKTIQKLSTQSAQLTIELQGYKDREEMYLQQLAKLNEMSESLVEGDFPETGEELMAHAALLTHTPNPSSYDETLASMKSRLDAVRESLKHTKRSLQSSQEQNQLIKKLYEDIANLRLLKEQSDQLHSEERAGLESSVQSINRKYEEALAAKNEELANARKTIQTLITQSAQTALEAQGYKDREEKVLLQIEKLKEESKSLVEATFSDTNEELLVQSDLLFVSNPSSYDETLALMKSRLHAVRESLKHTKHTPQSSQAQNQLISKLYEDMETLRILKEQSDKLHSEERAGLISSLQSMDSKYEQEMAARKNELDNETKTIQKLSAQSAQFTIELQGYKDREELYLQQLAKLNEMNESQVEVDFPETGEELMAQVALLTHTPNPSSYNETLAAMKSRLDAVRESLKHTKRSLQSSQEQNQQIKKLYEDMANLRLLKEQSDQLHSEERTGLESSVQSIIRKYEEALAAKNEELANERKTIQTLTSQSAQTALEVQGYRDREEKALQQIENLREENKSLVEATFPDTNEELLVQSDLLSVSNPSSYDETLALMKSRLHAVRESLKHTKHTPQSSQAQNQLINKLYEDMETLRILKERSDELHSEERAGLISGLQSMDSKYEQEMAARKNELDNETKTIQKQSAQFTFELQGYKDREEMYLQQLAKLNEMNESLVEVDFPETGEQLMAQAKSMSNTTNSSSYDETIAAMKSRLDAVRESLKHTKRSLQSSQEQNQLIKKLYEDMANLRLLKEQSDQLHSEERAGLESSVQSINKKYEEALTAKNKELANEMNAIQMLTIQSAQTALELQGYKDREEKFLQQIEKLKEENKSVVEATFPDASEELLMHSDLLSVSNPSSYDEALALMKSRLHAVSESLKHSKQSSHAQNQLINKLYEDMETLRTLKERSDKCHNEERTGLISSLHGMDNKYKQEMAAKKDELDNEARTIQKLSTQSAQITLELQGYKDREETYLQQIAKLKEMSESLVEVDFPETEVALLTGTPNPLSYDETLASIKSRLDAVRESLKHTKRSLQSSQEQNQLIKNLYEDIANLRLLKEQSDQLHSEERAGLESNVQSINRKYEEALAAKNEELANGMKTIHMLTTQSAQTALELQGYKDREKQIVKLKEENMFMPLVDPGFPDASEELLMHSDLLSVSNPSSYDETLALMKSRLHAVRESLKHTKHTPQSSQAQNQLISKLYEDMETLRILKEQSDKLHSEERAGLISSLQSMDSKNEQEMAARKNELDNETKTIQKLSAQSAQFTIELQGYKDREERYLQQLAKLNEMNESQVEVDFPETGEELMAQVALLTHTPNPSSYNETIAAMKSRLDAVRESLKHTKRSLQSSQEQNQLIKTLYEDIANLRLLKEQSDQLHSEERAGLESNVQSINRKYEEALAAKNEELANEMKTIHMLTIQSAHIALELQGYKDREEKFLQQIEKLREENKSVIEATFPDTNEELLVQSDMLSVSKPSSYNETLAMMKSHLHAIRESLNQTKHTHHSSQDQNQLINKLYEDMETLRILKEQSDELHSEERAGLISSLQSMDSKYEQEMAARKNELEEERKNAQKLLEFQSSQMAVELCHYKEREKLYLDQIAKLKGRTEALVGIDFPDSSEELLAGCNQSLISQPPTYKETLLQMRSAIDKLRQSLSHALQTSATLKQKEMLMRKLSGDIEDLRSHGEHNELLHCEEKTKLLTHIEQCNDEIHYLRADLQTMNSRCSEAAQEIVKASTMMTNDHELLLELREKLVNKEAEVQKYKGELESIQLAMLKQTSEAEEICTKDIEIARPQEQLVEHNKSKLDELNGEINHVSEHLQPISDMVKDDIVTEGQHSAHTMNMEDHKNREVLRKSNCYIFDQVKSMQTEIKNLRTLMLHSESQFRSDVERTALQFIENFISVCILLYLYYSDDRSDLPCIPISLQLKQKEISSFALQLMRQHEQEISVASQPACRTGTFLVIVFVLSMQLQKELTLKSGSEVKSDLISMLNAKDHQLQETNGRLEVTRTEHAEQVILCGVLLWEHVCDYCTV